MESMYSEDYPEQVHTELKEVEKHDIQYLTIGIVVNAPYGWYNDCC